MLMDPSIPHSICDDNNCEWVQPKNAPTWKFKPLLKFHLVSQARPCHATELIVPTHVKLASPIHRCTLSFHEMIMLLLFSFIFFSFPPSVWWSFLILLSSAPTHHLQISGPRWSPFVIFPLTHLTLRQSYSIAMQNFSNYSSGSYSIQFFFFFMTL